MSQFSFFKLDYPTKMIYFMSLTKKNFTLYRSMLLNQIDSSTFSEFLAFEGTLSWNRTYTLNSTRTIATIHFENFWEGCYRDPYFFHHPRGHQLSKLLLQATLNYWSIWFTTSTFKGHITQTSTPLAKQSHCYLSSPPPIILLMKMHLLATPRNSNSYPPPFL
jgi:hypothetical protein